MKKMVACLLVFVLLIGLMPSSLAVDKETGNDVLAAEQTAEGVPEEGEDAVGIAELTASGMYASETGEVEVVIEPALIFKGDVEFTVEMGGQKQTAVLAKDNGSVGIPARAAFSLVPGSYTLNVSAPGFASFSGEISVEAGIMHRIRLMTGSVEGFVYPGGILLIGDVNHDGQVDDTDKNLLIAEIEKGESTNTDADLNRDGKVDLADLEYFSKGYKTEISNNLSVEKSISPNQLAVSSSAEIVEGDIRNLLTGEGVKLAPASGEISDSNPISLELEVKKQDALMDGIIIETGEDSIEKAEFILEYVEDGLEHSVSTSLGNKGQEKSVSIPFQEGVNFLLLDTDIIAEQDKNGNISLNLKGQIAVKKVTLNIFAMKENNNLAEISKIEFVNGMEDRIPEPQLDIPTIDGIAGSKQISVSWDQQTNVTGYEVMITVEANGTSTSETRLVTGNSLAITSFGGKELLNYTEYVVSVQSVNGTWRSGYGTPIKLTPKPTGRPDKPDNVTAVGKYQGIDVSWKKMKDTLTYKLYYKEVGTTEYIKIEVGEANSYSITDLKDETEYVLYVTGVNEFGESAPSLENKVTTVNLRPVEMPKYKLINRSEEPGQKSSHITGALSGVAGNMVNSPLDEENPAIKSAWGMVDNDPYSYYLGGWDANGFNKDYNKGYTFEFDDVYEIDTIAFHQMETYGYGGLAYTRLRYWDADGTIHYLESGAQISLSSKTDKNNKIYYVIKLAEPIKTNKIGFGIGRSVASGNIAIAEVYFYHYDSIWKDIMGLYVDDMHTVLRANVTQATVNALRERINTKDPECDEYHPEREALLRELDTAEDILNNVSLKPPVEIHNGITTRNMGSVGGLNAWQPLGITAAAGEELTIYVGHSSKKTGETTELQLIATQYYAESNGLAKTVATLKIGANTVTIPKIGSQSAAESGGALYIQYTGNAANSSRYAVRVAGGTSVPILDLYKVTDNAERLARTKAYVEELQAYTSKIVALHNEHAASDNSSVKDYEYGGGQNCILGAADILLDTMMLSIPAQQILAGAGSGGVDEKAQKILNSMDAMEEMMYLFYQHKGLNQFATDEVDRIPKGHLNIRYMRMFSGAFMYASGNHIGIGWGSCTGLINGEPVVSEDGKYVSGRYFGWGIGHEIGHDINQGAYTVAEITNNYFAQLAQAKDTNEGMRFQYPNIYQKVTSGEKGPSSNIATQLGMYWQLHLAYDTGYNYKTYADYDTQLKNLFFARVDTYARTTSKAPAPGGVALTLGDTDQNIMRLACAAAEKNILEFFERWGKTPDEGTIAYASQFEKETRAIYYVCDDSRIFALTGSSTLTPGVTEAVSDDTVAVLNANTQNQVNFTLGSKNISEDQILGYEIVRCTISGGKVSKEPAGFVTGNTFTDTFATMNNRVVTYEVTLIDKYLNRSAVKVLEPIKIEHDGSLAKSGWLVTTTNITPDESTEIPADEDMPCEPITETAESKMIDQDISTGYTGKAAANAEIILEFNKLLVVTAFKYRGAPINGSYQVAIRVDGEWKSVAEGTGETEKTSLGTSEPHTIYFSNADGKYVSTYQADALKLTISTAQNISIAELDVLGVTGDNVDFRRTTGEGAQAVIGILDSDYKYGTEKDQFIPGGSLIFTGIYKGNPAYNIVLLYDQDGNGIGVTAGVSEAHQIIMADVPDTGNIQDVSNGTWIYWIEPENGKLPELSGVTKVRAELYRVNDALTAEGQRLVSDSYFEQMPKTLPTITLSGGALGNE